MSRLGDRRARRGALRWARRARKAVMVTTAGGVLATAAGTTAVLRSRSRRRDRIDRCDPCGPGGCRLPEGRPLVVPTQDGAHLAVTVAGPTDGPTVVLSHCWTGSQAIWATVARRLVLGGHRVVLYDQRGHGASTGGDAAPSIAALGEDLRAVLDATGATDVVLVGHSMGGMTIQAYAADHPDHFGSRVRAVVLVATAARRTRTHHPGSRHPPSHGGGAAGVDAARPSGTHDGPPCPRHAGAA